MEMKFYIYIYKETIYGNEFKYIHRNRVKYVHILIWFINFILIS